MSDPRQDDLRSRLARFPRVSFLEGPTPLQPLPRLSQALGGPAIWVKRDDAIPLGMGGNKVRKLEFLVGDAASKGCDTLITCGAVQSNHVRLTAAAANRSGMDCDIVLVDRVARNDPSYRRSGNRLLLSLLGAKVHLLPGEADDDLDGAMEKVAGEVRARGAKLYVVPEGGGSPTGGLGYAAAALEIAEQAAERAVSFKEIFVGSGSGGTHGGLLAGSTAIEAPWLIRGICVRRDAKAQATRIAERTRAILQYAGYDPELPAGSVHTDDSALGPGYGQMTDAVHEAITLTAQTEGLFLDPVYTGKVMAGLIAAVRQGRFEASDNILFIHSGGSPALFAYLEALKVD